MKRTAATIVREYGPFPDVTHVHGVSYDGTNIWIATGDTLNAIDTASGKAVRALDDLTADGKVQAIGRGRARRWMTPPVPGFPTTLLLPAALQVG